MAMDYPQDFPAESRARVEAARIRAGRQFDSKKAKAQWRSEIKALFWTYVLTPFLVFAKESSLLRLWPVDEMDQNCREFLRRLTIDAYYGKGKAAGLSDVIDNISCGIRWEDLQEIEKTSQWRSYESIRLKLAESSSVQNSEKAVQGADKLAVKDRNQGGRPRKDKERDLVRELKARGLSWKEITAEMNTRTNQNKTPEAYRSLLRSPGSTKPPGKNEQN